MEVNMASLIRAMIWGTTVFVVMFVVRRVFNREITFDVDAYLGKLRQLGC
jgi:hypothetical protein